MKLRTALCLLSMSVFRGQIPPPATHATTQEVLLDLVVRDKKGRRVADVNRSDLEIYDNGVRREITSFRLIEGAEARLVTLVFHGLDLNSRSLARKAPLDFLRIEFPPNLFMSVLVLDDEVHVIQAFTNDREVLRKVVERAISGTSSEFIADSKRIEAELKVPASGRLGAAMAQIILNTLQSPRGPGTPINQLTRIANEQFRVPGRKSVLLFSPGFGVPSGMEYSWKALLSAANRFNVAFYTIDSPALTTASLNSEQVSELQDEASAARLKTLTHGNGTVTPAIAKAQDTAIDAGNAHGLRTLADLAKSTGGFLISNTRDLRRDFAKMSEDLESYYQVTYHPQIEKYDGSFRTIEVRAKRPNLRIQSRAGYFAVQP